MFSATYCSATPSAAPGASAFGQHPVAAVTAPMQPIPLLAAKNNQ